MRKFFTTILTLLLLGLPVSTRTEMTSASYTIYADSVNTGGILSTGGDYSLEDTIGESPLGVNTGGVFEVRGGYQAMIRSSLSLTVDNSNLNLGTLSSSTIATASTTAEITTDDDFGYTLSIGSVVGTAIASVTDGSVTVGTEEYGFSVSGSDSLFSGDVAVTSAIQISASSTPVNASQTILDFKASISSGTAPGTYTQNISLIASTNL